MTSLLVRNRGRWLGPPRFLLVFSIVSWYQELLGQSSDSLAHIFAAARYEYFDVFRQTTDRSHAVLFARSSFFRMGIANAGDSLFLGLSASDLYGVYDSNSPDLSGGLANTVRMFTAGCKTSFWFSEWGLSLSAPLDRSPGGLFYRFSCKTLPLGEFLTATALLERSPLSQSSLFHVEDFFASFGEAVDQQRFILGIEVFPTGHIGGLIRIYSSFDRSQGASSGYSAVHASKGYGTEASLFFRPSDDQSGWLIFSTNFLKMDDELKSNGLLFGDLTAGSFDWSRWSAGYKGSSWRVQYSFTKYGGSGAGHIEAWPFTPLAATVFDNRLMYRFNAAVECHSLAVTPQAVSFWLVPEAEYFFVRSALDIEHWEPEFLVFGVKNYALNPFSIEKAHFVRLGVHTILSVFGARIRVELEQYLPLRVTYRPSPADTSTGATPGPATKTSTDGGRRIVVELQMQ